MWCSPCARYWGENSRLASRSFHSSSVQTSCLRHLQSGLGSPQSTFLYIICPSSSQLGGLKILSFNRLASSHVINDRLFVSKVLDSSVYFPTSGNFKKMGNLSHILSSLSPQALNSLLPVPAYAVPNSVPNSKIRQNRSVLIQKLLAGPRLHHGEQMGSASPWLCGPLPDPPH